MSSLGDLNVILTMFSIRAVSIDGLEESSVVRFVGDKLNSFLMNE